MYLFDLKTGNNKEMIILWKLRITTFVQGFIKVDDWWDKFTIELLLAVDTNTFDSVIVCIEGIFHLDCLLFRPPTLIYL